MSIYEFDQELHNRTLKDEGFQYGKAVGKEEGIIVGMSRGTTAMILNMYEDNYPLEQIAHISRKSVDEVRTIIEQEAENTRE